MNSKEAIEKIRRILFGSHSFNMLKTVDGVELKVEGDVELEKEIYIITPEGELPLSDGEYEVEDGMKLSVKEGKVSKIDYSVEEKVEEDEVSMEETIKEDEMESTEEVKMVTAELVDGTIVENDEEELKVGDMLYVSTEEGRVTPPDAEHETIDGSIVVTKDGIIVEIREKEEIEESVEEVVEEELSFDELLETFTAGFNHLTSQLNELKENYDSLQENFNKFSAEPAGERVFNHKNYVENKQKERFSKLETLAALKNKIK